MFRGVLVTIPLALLCACSAIQIGYNHADTMIQWRAAKYFDFEGAQKAEFERRVQRFLAWHRRAALPEYARLAHEMGDRLARGLSQADLVWGYDTFQTQLRQSIEAGSAQMGDLLDALSPAQVERFRARLDEENRERAKEYGLDESIDERRERRAKRNIERLEDWFGTLSDAQVERVRLYSANAPLDGTLRDLDRKRLQRELLAMIREREARARLAQWAVAWDKRRHSAYSDALEANLREYFRMLLDLDRTLSPAQRDRAVRRLRAFAGDFTALAALQGSAR